MRMSRAAAVVVAGLLGLTACGTRVPDQQFTGNGTLQGGAGSGGDLGTGGGGDLGTGTTGGGGSGGVVGSGGGTTGSGSTGTTSGGGGGSTSTGGGSATTGRGGSGGGTTGGTSGGGSGAAGNTASDRGVTPTTITVGNITSMTSSIFGNYQFSPSAIGAEAYFKWLNDTKGGIHGRKVNFIRCDDQGQTDQNNTCAHQLVDQYKAFGMVGNNMFQFPSAKYLSDADIPVFGGQPITEEYYQYPHLFNMLGDGYPHNGSIGYQGKLWAQPGANQYYHDTLGAKRAAVVYYDQASSKRGAFVRQVALQHVGFQVDMISVNFALPNWNGAAQTMLHNGDDIVFDALDNPANQHLCQAMDSNGVTAKIKAKVSTISTWTGDLSGFESACRNKIFSDGNSRNFQDLNDPQVAQFQQAIQRYEPSWTAHEAQWMLEGWAAAMWFSDAAESCGAKLTRDCVESYWNTKTYTANGLINPTSFAKVAYHDGLVGSSCWSAVRWQDSANGGKGGWVDAQPVHTCANQAWFSYPSD